MALAALQCYARGEQAVVSHVEETSRSMLSRRARRTVHTTSQHRPLFVADAELRAGSKWVSRAKRVMLALCGDQLLVLDVAGVDADSSGADVTSHILRWLSYLDLLDVSMCGPSTLRIEAADTSDKAKMVGPTDPAAAAAAAAGAACAGSSSNNEPPEAAGSAGGASAASATSAGSTAAPGAGAAGAATIRLTSEAFTLTFLDAGAAQQAAAAIMFMRAQAAALRSWLADGLHAGLRCDLVSVTALPLHYDSHHQQQQQGHPQSAGASVNGLVRSHSLVPQHALLSAGGCDRTASGSAAAAAAAAAGGAGDRTASGSAAAAAAAAAGASQASTGHGGRGDAATGTAAAAAAAAAAPYPWADGAVAQGWGALVPLPASWGRTLDAAAEAAASEAAAADGSSVGDGDEAAATADDLCRPVPLDAGPKALQVAFSTPLGAAVATITPQLARAALLSSSCREVLALPLAPAWHPSGPWHAHGGSSSSSSCGFAGAGGPPVSFSWAVESHVAASSAAAAAAADGGSASPSRSRSRSHSHSHAPLSGTADRLPAAALSAAAGSTHHSSSSSSLALQHRQEAFAALSVELVRTPATAGSRGAGSVCVPDALRAADAKCLLVPEAQHKADSGISSGDGVGKAAQAAGVGGADRQQLQLALYVVLGALALTQLGGRPAFVLLQLLLLAALAALTLAGADRGSEQEAAQDAAHGTFAGAWAAASAGSWAAREGVSCCGWSLRLVASDVCSSPSRHLQLQVTLARSTRGMARLRLRMASMSAGGSAVMQQQQQAALLAAAAAQGVAVGVESVEEEPLPVLVSEPEPAWLSPDVKQRFLNAKPNLEASQEQAQRTHAWRQELSVDSVLLRPCPKFALLCSLLPTYLLTDDSPEGNAVMLMKVCGVKDLCDAIFNTREGGQGLTMGEAEHSLALINEYLVQVAAPEALPAGFQVQVYDVKDVKLSYVNGDMIELFKMLVRFGLYYPERLQQALVINAPAWFSYPWKVLSAFLDPVTSAKVVVVGAPKAALPELSHHLGGKHNVPVAWGGTNTTPLALYPANVRMMDFARALNAGEQPLARAPHMAEAARAFRREGGGAESA